MANKQLFSSSGLGRIPPADAVNEAGGYAYARAPKAALAQYAATGVFGNTYYTGARTQLDEVLALCTQVDPKFIAKTAIYARRQAHMKDMPALLCAVLAVRAPDLLEGVFERVIDNAKMLRNFVQIVRSGLTGRRSLGSLPRRLVRQWLDARDDEALFRASVGQSPSLADVIKMVHPKPKSASREALYGYLLGREHDAQQLPELVQAYERFRQGLRETPPDVPFQMLAGLALGSRDWVEVFRKAPWQMTRMNLNTALRQGVFDYAGMRELIAARLSDARQIRRARAFPYQLLAAYLNASDDVPFQVRDALHEAMEIAIENVPEVAGRVVVCPDVSGSMGAPVTGYRKGASSAVRCVDVAGLVASAFLRRNPQTRVLPFEIDVVDVRLEARDTVLSNTRRLTDAWGGGTDCSAPLKRLNREKARVDLVVFVSDNESWVDTTPGSWRNGTALMREWERLKRRNPRAKMVCIDITPTTSVQAVDREDILNIGGFSDQVFDLIAGFSAGESAPRYWVKRLESIAL